ncbi:MAG: M23 family metallopeptidase [Erysipelotrichaceae bacterium]|nr:M23 family metallopeptidase [Erysipelotrichaceae bacterium]
MYKKFIDIKKIVVVTLALVLFLGGVGIIQKLLEDSNDDFEDESVVKVEENDTTVASEESDNQEKADETLASPVEDGIGIVRYYYNKDDSSEKQEQSLILFEGVYRPNDGIDYAKSGETFNVLAAISGTVTKKTNDAVLGWVVTITNSDDIQTTYESLSEVNVELNQEVSQGETIGKSGENVYESDLGNHLNFILQKGDTIYNPENYIGKELTSIS